MEPIRGYIQPIAATALRLTTPQQRIAISSYHRCPCRSSPLSRLPLVYSSSLPAFHPPQHNRSGTDGAT